MECLHTVPFSVVKFFFVVFPMSSTGSSTAFGYHISLTPFYLEHSTNLHFFMRLTILKFLFRGFLEVSSWLDLRITFHNHFNCFACLIILFLSSLYMEDTWLLCGCKYFIWFQNMSSCLVIYGFPFYSLQKNKLFWPMKCNISILYKLYF